MFLGETKKTILENIFLFSWKNKASNSIWKVAVAQKAQTAVCWNNIAPNFVNFTLNLFLSEHTICGVRESWNSSALKRN